MLIIPALDIKSNKIVRLEKGDFNKIKIFSDNPLNIIIKLPISCKRIHLVDLDGAIKGYPKNLFIIKLIKYFINNIKLQIGGGIRSIEILKYYLDLGIFYIILGTKFINNLNLFKNIINKYPYKIILSLDLKFDKILINGWDKENSNTNLFKFLNKIKSLKLNSIIYTDTLKDGLSSGLNYKFAKLIFKNININILISGGLKNIEDYKTCYKYNNYNIIGFICGKSIYTGYFNYKNILIYNNIYNKYYLRNE